MEVTPAGVLATWAAGHGGGLALVASLRIAGAGYAWLASGVTLALGLAAAAAGSRPWLLLGCALVLAAAMASRRRTAAAILAVAAAAVLAVGAAQSGLPWLAVVTGAASLGAVTTEMMLGHWYLVDPSLPRPILRAIALAGVAAVALDGVAIAALGAVPWVGEDGVLGLGFLVLAGTSMILMGLVWSALGERGYAGVMAATGLSYLAVLTTAGAMVVGRMLV